MVNHICLNFVQFIFFGILPYAMQYQPFLKQDFMILWEILIFMECFSVIRLFEKKAY